MAALIILANADPRSLRHTAGALSEAGHLVAAIRSLPEAQSFLDSVLPDLLIADVHLSAYNGLQLAIRCHYDHPEVPVIVTHTRPDAVTEETAKAYGAIFVAEPLRNPRFLPTVAALLTPSRSRLNVAAGLVRPLWH